MIRKEFIRIDQGTASQNEYSGIYSVFLHCYEQESYGIISFDIDSLGILAKVLKGELLMEAINLSYKGKKCDPHEFAEIMQKKITYIDREPTFSGELSISDNVFIARKMRGIADRKQEKRELQEVLAQFRIPISLNRQVSELEPFEIYVLELIRAYLEKKEGIILDFNTWNMSYEQFVKFKLLIRLLEKRGMTFIWLDINVERAASICDAIMMFYRRKTARLLEYGPFSEREIMKYIPLDSTGDHERHLNEKSEEVIFEMQHVSTPLIRDINLRISKGEMCTIYCRNRNELVELAEVIKGIRTCSGTILYHGKDIQKMDPYQRIEAGICFMEWENSLLEDMTVYDNLCLPRGSKVKDLWRNRKYQKSIIADIDKWIGKDLWNRYVYELTDEYKIKLAYYKWSLYRPEILFVLTPFTTLDDSMNEWIRNIRHDFIMNQVAVISVMDYEFRNKAEKGTLYIFDKTIKEL